MDDPSTDTRATPPHRAGFVALVGRPNAGKSTLLNQVLGQKLSIVSAKPQTTRNRVVGICTRPGAQLVLVDTPGIHAAKSRFNRGMVQVATTSLADVDVVAWVVDLVPACKAAKDGRSILSQGEHAIAEMIAQSGAHAVTIVLNKADIVPRPWILPVMEALARLMPDARQVPVSALKGEGVEPLLQVWEELLPEGPAMYPADQVTEAPERFIVSELIREKIFHLTQEEVPYSTAVEIELFEEEEAPPGNQGKGEPPPGRVHIMARIYVERDSQKGILIGKGGLMLKQIGTMARKDIERLLGARVFLELHVSVRKEWTSSGRALKELGYE